MIATHQEAVQGATETVQSAAENLKIAATVGGGTIAAGVGTYLDKIPDILGIIATSLGIIVSTYVLFGMVAQHKRTRLQNQKLMLEISELKAKKAEREENE